LVLLALLVVVVLWLVQAIQSAPGEVKDTVEDAVVHPTLFDDEGLYGR
jgi:hypothetical protein